MKKSISHIDKEGNIQSQLSPNQPKKSKSENSDYLRYMNIGFYLVTPLVVGVFLGLQLDKWLGKKPLFTVSLIILGAISSLYNLVKLTKENS